MSRDINRGEWTEISPSGEILETKTTVRSNGVDIEDYDGWVQVSICAHKDGIDFRAIDLQVVVNRHHVTVMQQRPPYPINRWTVLWEGDLS